MHNESILHDKFCPLPDGLFVLNGWECLGHHSFRTVPIWWVYSVIMTLILEQFRSKKTTSSACLLLGLFFN